MLFCPVSLLSGVSSLTCIEGEHVFVLFLCWVESVVDGTAMGRLSLHALKENMSFLSSLFVGRGQWSMGWHEFCYYRYIYWKGNVGFVFSVCWAGSVVDGTAGVVLLPLHVLQGKCRFCLLCLLSRVSSRWDGTSIVTTVTYIKRETSVLSSLFADQG